MLFVMNSILEVGDDSSLLLFHALLFFSGSGSSVCGPQQSTVTVWFASKINCTRLLYNWHTPLCLVLYLFTLFNAFFLKLSFFCMSLHMLVQTQTVNNTEMPSFDFRGKKALSKKKLKRRQKVKSKVKSRTKVSCNLKCCLFNTYKQ